MNPGRGTRAAAWVALAACAGCTTETVRVEPHRGRFVDPGPPLRAAEQHAAVLPLGAVPYDNRSLPLPSPDGRFVATQVGAAPDWPTLLAGSGAAVPRGTRVEVHAVDGARGESELRAHSAWGVLLGRGGDGAGVLVESPRDDGARWIGRLSWYTGAVDWLVADGHVNAFACVNGAGRLAWSRRAVGGEHFDLVIRHGDEQWTLGAQGGDWLMPAWSGGAGLFAVRLEDGRLELASMVARDPETTRETLRRLPLAEARGRRDAYQCLASRAGMAGTAKTAAPHVLFWHPSAMRMGLWDPVASPAASTLLPPASFAAVLDGTGRALVTTDDYLLLLDLDDPAAARRLLPGAWVPRAVDNETWPWMLLKPGPDRIELLALRLER